MSWEAEYTWEDNDLYDQPIIGQISSPLPGGYDPNFFSSPTVNSYHVDPYLFAQQSDYLSLNGPTYGYSPQVPPIGPYGGVPLPTYGTGNGSAWIIVIIVLLLILGYGFYHYFTGV